MTAKKTVFVVDDDALLRQSVCALVESMGIDCRGFATAEEFLAAIAPGQRGMVVADLRMPGMSGLELQQELARRESQLPLILLTAHARTAITVKAMLGGAMTVIDKPYHEDELWDAVRAALAREEAAWCARQQRHEVLARLATLSAEEQQVMELLRDGRPNKAIAAELGLAARTVEKRRHDVLAKMKAGSIAELVALLLVARPAE